MSNLNRKLNIGVTITDPSKAGWLWEFDKWPGVIVTSISDTPDAEEYFIREIGESTEEAIKAHMYGGFDTVEEAKTNAVKNLADGEAFEIVDRNGNVYFETESKAAEYK